MALGRKKKSNYDTLKERDYAETMGGRDVHGEQNYSDKGEASGPVSMASRRVISIGAGILSAMIIFVLWSVCLNLIYGKNPDNMFDFSNFTLSHFYMYGLHSMPCIIGSICGGLMVFLFVDWRMRLNLRARNALYQRGNLTVYTNDGRLQEPEEVAETYDIFPATGFHSGVAPSSLLSYMPCSNKGLKKVPMAKRYDKDVEDDDGTIHYKGEIMYDENDEVIYTNAPIFDEEFQDELFRVAGVPRKSQYHRRYDIAQFSYNPKDKFGARKSLDKLKFDTIGELIEQDWEWPDFEVQRPGGVYVVDTAPVNTMMLAITRAGKGQTYIEPIKCYCK